jgi:type I restriction enzyme M protein
VPDPSIDRMAIDPSHPLTLSALEDHLWRAADLFRNKVSNQKDFILALLFFKRASDTFEESVERLAAELEEGLGSEEARAYARQPRLHALVVPEGASWVEARATDNAKLGEAFNRALRAVATANPNQLAGVFERIDFNDRQTLPPEDLASIVDHFQALGPLTAERVPPDMLGRAYEWLIAKFAAQSGKAGGEFYTPAEVGQLLATILDPQEGERANDPTCGSGGLLLALRDRAAAEGRNPAAIGLTGQELNPETWALARMNMLLHGAGDAARIERGDTLLAPAFVDDHGRLDRFDLVIANPPFSPKNWGHERLKKSGDPFGRIRHLPPKSHGELAFVQHMVATLADDGRMAVVLPNGVLFREGAEFAVRRELVEQDLVEAVIQLPKDMFFGAGIPACVLVCRRAKSADRRGQMLMIDASALFERVDTKNRLTAAGIERIAETFRLGREEEGFSRWVSRSEATDGGLNLTVRRFVRGIAGSVEHSRGLADAIADLKAAQVRRHEAEGRLAVVLEELQASSEQA